MSAALVAVAALLALLALLLAVPLQLAFWLRQGEALSGRLTIGWLFGLVRVRVPIGSLRSAGPAEGIRRRPQRQPQASRRGAVAWALLRDARFRRRAWRLVHDLVDAVHWRRFELRLRLGLGDPADTGQLWAGLGPLALLMAQRHPQVRIEPDFAQAALGLRAVGQLWVMPLRVLWLGAGFALAASSIRAGQWLRGDSRD